MNITFNNPVDFLKINLAKQYIKLYPRDLFVGVGGSLGRTTCVQACVAVLSSKFKTLSTSSKLDSFNISQTLLKLTPNSQKVILEMGVNLIGQMDFYLSQVKPKTVIVTKIAMSDCEYLGGLDEIIEEQAKLVKQLDETGVAILNFDDPLSKRLIPGCKGSIIYFGSNPEHCTVWVGNIKVEGFRTTFELNLGVERVKINFPFLGSHHIFAALAAATLGVVNKIPLTKIKLSLESLESQEHQMQVLTGPNGSIILDDTLHSSPDEVEAAIDVLLQVSARRRVLVLGEMKNLGEFVEKQHRLIAGIIFKEKIDLVLLGQGDAEIIAAELNSLGFLEERLHSNLHSSQIVSKLLKTLGKGDVVLIKGSKAQRLDEVVKRIAKKN